MVEHQLVFYCNEPHNALLYNQQTANVSYIHHAALSLVQCASQKPLPVESHQLEDSQLLWNLANVLKLQGLTKPKCSAESQV